jgi:hypothetical protein
MATSPPDVTFRRDLIGPRLVAWNVLLQRLATVQLSPEIDVFRWNLHKNGEFFVDSMYNALIHLDIPVDNNNMIWKMKISLKTKVFGWYLRRGVILTKDNLAKRNWHRSKSCILRHQDETIKHLFFQYRFTRSIWSIIQVTSTLYPSRSVANIFGNWLHGIDNRFRTLIRVGVLAVVWSLWLCINDKVFNNKPSSPLQVIYRCIGTLHLWSSLQRVEHQDLFTEVCTRLETTTMDTFFPSWVAA